MRRVALALGIVVVGSAAVAVYRQASRLYINGELASSNLIQRDGVAYVPVKDVAAALHLTARQSTRGIELSAQGGANQVEGMRGKIGDVLFNGYWRFQVVKVLRQATYTRQFSPNVDPVTPTNPADDLVIVVCRLKNGMQKAAAPSYVGGAADALTDTDGHSYEPRRTSDLPIVTDVLPGAATDFALIFQVPHSATLQDLVFEAETIGAPESAKRKFRVALQE